MARPLLVDGVHLFEQIKVAEVDAHSDDRLRSRSGLTQDRHQILGCAMCLISEVGSDQLVGLWIEATLAGEGDMWPASFALKELTFIEAAKIAGLVKKAAT
jgi:hypothetical protein